MKKRRLLAIAVVLLALCMGVPAGAAGYEKITHNKKKIGSYYMWIDGGSRLHIRKTSARRDLDSMSGCKGGISDGRTVYYYKKYGSRQLVYKYSLSAKKGKKLASLQGVSGIEGAYQNRLILAAALPRDGVYDTLYAYDMNTGKMKRISYSCQCAGTYRQYFVFEGTTGAICPVHVGVYNAKTNKSKTLTEKSWYTAQHGKQLYYAKEVGSTSSFYIRKLKIYRYTMTTGKKKAMSKTLTVSIAKNNRLTNNKFTYYGKDGKKRTLRF